MSRASKRNQRNPNDFYPTPHKSIKSILPYVEACGEIEWLEPACGDGRIVKLLKGRGIKAKGFDIQTGQDFFKYNKSCQGIITNPPFSCADGFIKHALDLTYYYDILSHVFLLLRVGHLATQRRNKWWQDKLPDALFVLSARPSFSGDNKTDCADYAWYYWGEIYNGIYVI